MTTIMQEAKKTTTDTSSGKEQMRSFKHLRETFGRKNAEKIRERKKQQELTRDVVAEPKPWWFAHPEAGDDPAAGHVQQIIITGYNDNNNNIYIFVVVILPSCSCLCICTGFDHKSGGNLEGHSFKKRTTKITNPQHPRGNLFEPLDLPPFSSLKPLLSPLGSPTCSSLLGGPFDLVSLLSIP